MDSQTWALVWPPIIAAMIGAFALYYVFARGRDGSAAGNLVTRVSSIETKMSAMEVKVDTMWQFQLRRGISEAVITGLATKNSPLRFTDEALAYLDTMRAELIAYYKAMMVLKPDLSDADQLLNFEMRFGKYLADEICEPCKLSHASCLLMALAVAKQQNPIDFDL